MYQWLKSESRIVQNGVALAGPLWLMSNISAMDDNVPMATFFLFASLVGIGFGQTKTGVITQAACGFLAYCFMGLSAVQWHHWSELTSCFGGLLMNIRVFADNFRESRYNVFLPKTRADKRESFLLTPFLFISGLPKYAAQSLASGLQKLRPETLSHFGRDLMEITQRPIFAGASFGATCDLGYLWSGLVTYDISKTISGFIWMFAYFLIMISCPKDGQLNIYKFIYQKIRGRILA